jgi:hypothetical protein
MISRAKCRPAATILCGAAAGVDLFLDGACATARSGGLEVAASAASLE